MIGETEAIVLHYAAKGKEIYGCNPGLIKSNIRDSLHGGGTKLSIDMVITILYALCQIIFVVVLLSYQGHAYDTLWLIDQLTVITIPHSSDNQHHKIGFFGGIMEGLINMFNPSPETYAANMLPLFTAPELSAHKGTMFGQKGTGLS